MAGRTNVIPEAMLSPAVDMLWVTLVFRTFVFFAKIASKPAPRMAPGIPAATVMPDATAV